jgi:hypothetical protein
MSIAIGNLVPPGFKPGLGVLASLGLMLGAGAPAFAEHGGGGGHANSGGHFGGAAHAGYAGGGHAAGYAHAAGYRGSVGGYHGAAGYRGVSGGVAGGYHGAVGGAVGAAGYHVSGRGSYGYPGAYHYGYSAGAYWHGGYWRGGFWPGAYYGAGYAWFLPILPLAYATYWWGGVPYYYANDVYYTWNPGYDGYVATDPPPVADEQGAAAAPMDQAAPQAPRQAPDGAGSTQLFMYPKNGQSEEQQSADRRECQQWAASQAGADGANAPDYRRAMMACVEGRGYSAN